MDVPHVQLREGPPADSDARGTARSIAHLAKSAPRLGLSCRAQARQAAQDRPGRHRARRCAAGGPRAMRTPADLAEVARRVARAAGEPRRVRTRHRASVELRRWSSCPCLWPSSARRPAGFATSRRAWRDPRRVFSATGALWRFSETPGVRLWPREWHAERRRIRNDVPAGAQDTAVSHVLPVWLAGRCLSAGTAHADITRSKGARSIRPRTCRLHRIRSRARVGRGRPDRLLGSVGSPQLGQGVARTRGRLERVASRTSRESRRHPRSGACPALGSQGRAAAHSV